MNLKRFGGLLILSLVFTGAFARGVAAQSTVTNADIQRLQNSIFEASRDLADVRARDAGLATQLQAELDDLSDETTYLRVKLRKHEPIARSEYADVRDRIENLRERARSDAGGRYSVPSGSTGVPGGGEGGTVATGGRNVVPTGTEFDVRLQSTLSSATSQVEDRFDATTLVDLRDERGHVIVPSGSTMRGIVTSVHKATRTERTGKLTVVFDRVTVNGRSYPLQATVTQAIESEGIKGEAAKIGAGAGAGAIIGAILGGVKGAVAGILIGGGGTIAATEGKDVELPAGTVLRIRLDSPLSLQR